MKLKKKIAIYNYCSLLTTYLVEVISTPIGYK